MLKKLAAAVVAAAIIFGSAGSALAMDTVDYGVRMYWETCLSTKVPGNFLLQLQQKGSSTWKTVGYAKAWDDRLTEDGSCPAFAVGVLWKPTVPGIVTVRLFNTAQQKAYHQATVRVSSPAPAAPVVETVYMPSLIGRIDGQVRSLLLSSGYKFYYSGFPHSTGYNPKQSCLMSGQNYVQAQSPQPGTVVRNDSTTRVEIYVNCEW